MINKSKTYLAPLVLSGLEGISFSSIKDTYLFLDLENTENAMYFFCKKDSVNIELLKHYKHVFIIYEYEEEYLIGVYILEEYNFEYLSFLSGKYSYFRPSNKEIIVHYLYNNVNNKSKKVIDTVINVFGKNPMLKKHYEDTLGVKLDETAELSSKALREEETFNSVKYGKFVKIKETTSILAD